MSLETGETAICRDCGDETIIDTEVLDLFGFRVGFGRGGPDDRWVERDDEIRCAGCAADEYGDIDD